MVSTRIGAIFDGTTGFFEGALVWVVSVLLMLYFAGTSVGLLAGGAMAGRRNPVAEARTS